VRPSSPLAARAKVPSPLDAGDVLRALRAVPILVPVAVGAIHGPTCWPCW